ncbi:hypothetical protein [Ancylobacter radicis]|uniref:HEPN domain-containing protein n=1 Tax=Ancylobacter radicis TaxID=2836179 RepID=A0ABS5RA58_9HYPH|nr:hypothetical protein [Ancylobacter radicis]MBS9478554.1 hypothetical protein [Ancylobacter radicis]
MSDELLGVARRLAKASPKKPRQADLRRAVSTSYYALFHALARNAADVLVGVGTDRPDKAWNHAYRALDHGFAKKACRRLRDLGFPPDLCLCGDAFVILQEARHEADYNPSYKIDRAETLAFVATAESAIASLKSASRRDRKALAVQLLLNRRI